MVVRVLVLSCAVGCPVTIALASRRCVTVSLCLLISLGTLYKVSYAVAAVLYDQLYAVAFNQSQLLLLSPPR